MYGVTKIAKLTPIFTIYKTVISKWNYGSTENLIKNSRPKYVNNIQMSVYMLNKLMLT